jgi:LmbE family N-acetylglucosaminyl deacetylase
VLSLRLENVNKVLCLGAHSDDIEIGAGGTILSMLAARSGIELHWVVFSASGKRADEARASAERFARNCSNLELYLFDFRDGYFPYVGSDVKDRFEALKGSTPPDLILTHHGDDKHQDHRIVSELTWNTFRNHLILEYEILKYDGGLGSPNLFAELSPDLFAEKVDILMDVFASQRSRRWFNAQSFEAIARLRGLESNAESGLAEGFYCRKGRLLW